MLTELLEDFWAIREKNVIKIKELKEQGRKVVGIYCTFCPNELVIAAGAIPVGLCGTRDEPIAAAEETLPRNLCPLIKSSYGFAVTDTCPFFFFSDLIVGETTCDGKKKMFEIMGELKPVHVMQLPNLKGDGLYFQLWVDEIRRLRARLERELCAGISDEALWEAIDLVNRETRAVKEICDLNRQDPPALNGLELLAVVWSKGFSADRSGVVDMLVRLKEALVERQFQAAAGKSCCCPGPGREATSVPQWSRPRVLLTGCPVGLGSEKVVRLVEEKGGAVVAMENCTGYKTLELETGREHDDPIVALAHKYIRIPCSCMSPNQYRLELLERMIADFNPCAVVDLTWQACHTYNIEAYAVERLAAEKGLPYLHLETDYSASDREALKVRIEALLEMAR